MSSSSSRARCWALVWLVCIILVLANFFSSSQNFSTTNSNLTNNKKFPLPSSWSHPGETQHGNQISSYQANTPPLHLLWSTGGIGTPGSVPIIDHTRSLIYCPISSGLSTLNLLTGDILWSTNFQERSSSPIYSSDGSLFMLVNSCLYSLQATTGQVFWKTCVPSSTGFMNSPVLSPLTGQVYFTVGTILYSLSPSDGTILWSTDLGTGTDSSSSPESKATLLYYPVMDNKDHHLYFLLSHTLQDDTLVIQFSPPTIGSDGAALPGYISWSLRLLCRSYSALLWHDQVIYIACGNTLHAYYPGGYYPLWEYLFDHSIGLSSPVARPSDGVILITTTQATVYAILSGTLLWKLELEAEISLAQNSLNRPVLDKSERLFVTNALGKLYIVSREGTLLWTRESSSVLRIFSSPAITSSGAIVLLESSHLIGGQVKNQYSLTLLGNKTRSTIAPA
jgi:outer membrane protein assembly factor BamB